MNVNVFTTDCKYGQHGNYFEMFILPNGTLFMSEPYLESLLQAGGVESLAFALLNEISHVIKKHSRQNLQQSHKYGDLKKQFFLFENQYTGFDALFIDYYTNTRYKID